MENLNGQVKDVYSQLDESLMPSVSDGDIPANIRARIELIHDQLAELYLLTGAVKKSKISINIETALPNCKEFKYI